MLKRHREFYKSILLLIDFVLISIGWVSAYWLRFYTDLIPVTKGVPDFTMMAIHMTSTSPIVYL